MLQALFQDKLLINNVKDKTQPIFQVKEETTYKLQKTEENQYQPHKITILLTNKNRNWITNQPRLQVKMKQYHHQLLVLK